MRYYLIIILILASNLSLLAQQEKWETPADRTGRLAPFEFSDASVTAGEGIYALNCKSCHGDPGQGNYQPLVPVPGDPATDKIQDNSDGDLQYKIAEGRGLMPSFKRVLSEDDIWNVIAYIRSFNNSYTQQVAVVQKLTNLKWSQIKILFTHNPAEHTVKATLKGLEGEAWTPVPGAGVMLSAKRYFGDLPLDGQVVTDENGDAIFNFPADLPGDSEGRVTLSASLTNTDLFGIISKDTVIAAGINGYRPPLTESRAMWNVNRKAPVWLLFAYPGVVLAVWSLIFYVLFQVRKIYFEGEDE